MRANNSLQAQGNRPKFSVAIQGDKYKKLINDTLGDPERARRFVAAISSAAGQSMEDIRDSLGKVWESRKLA